MWQKTCCSSVAFERPNENVLAFTFTPAALHGPLLCVGPMGRQVSAAAETLRSKLAEVEPEVRRPRVCSLMLDALPPHAKVPVGGMVPGSD